MLARPLILTAVAALVALVGLGFQSAPASSAEIESSIARGGRLYDVWYKEIKQERPDDAHPSYPASGKKPKSSWRCIECHGWDYKGNPDLGTKGISGAAGKDPKAIAAIIRDKTHAYPATKLSDKDADDLALFVSKGQGEPAKYIDPAKGSKGDSAKGEIYYNTLCAGCHGVDGKKVSTGAAIGAASNAPYMMLHRARNGLPGEAMPALRSLDPNVAADIVAYTKLLPQ